MVAQKRRLTGPGRFTKSDRQDEILHVGIYELLW